MEESARKTQSILNLHAGETGFAYGLLDLVIQIGTKERNQH